MYEVTFGLPDDKWGEVIAAFILSETVPDVPVLTAHCRGHLSTQKTTTAWVRVSDVPYRAPVSGQT